MIAVSDPVNAIAPPRILCACLITAPARAIVPLKLNATNLPSVPARSIAPANTFCGCFVKAPARVEDAEKILSACRDNDPDAAMLPANESTATLIAIKAALIEIEPTNDFAIRLTILPPRAMLADKTLLHSLAKVPVIVKAPAKILSGLRNNAPALEIVPATVSTATLIATRTALTEIEPDSGLFACLINPPPTALDPERGAKTNLTRLPAVEMTAENVRLTFFTSVPASAILPARVKEARYALMIVAPVA